MSPETIKELRENAQMNLAVNNGWKSPQKNWLMLGRSVFNFGTQRSLPELALARHVEKP